MRSPESFSIDATPVPSVELDGCAAQLSGECRRLAGEELGRLLDEFRRYLLVIANEQFPASLGGKLSPSDLVQETILKGYQQFETFRGGTREELARWLRQILMNCLANFTLAYARDKREIGRERPLDSGLVHPGEAPSTPSLAREEKERVENGLAHLSDLYRSVVLLRHRDGLSFPEIGLRIGRTAEAARKLWARGIRQLQQEMGTDDA